MTDTATPAASPVERVTQRWLVTPLLLLARGSVIAMCLVTMADVIGRHFLGLAVPGIVELVELALVWSAFAGIAVAFWTGAHVSVDLIELLASRRVMAVTGLVNAMIVLAVAAWLARLAVGEFLDELEWGDRTADLSLPYAWYWAAVVVGYAAAAVLQGARTFSLRRRRSTP